jgi:hypothetical protein
MGGIATAFAWLRMQSSGNIRSGRDFLASGLIGSHFGFRAR